MAYEVPGFSLGFLKAAVSMSANQFKCVKVTADDTFNLCTVAGESFVGVLQDIPPAGAPGQIMRDGVTKVLVGVGGLTAGQNWMTAADGTAIAATAGKISAGMVTFGAVQGKIASVTVGKQDGAAGALPTNGLVAESAGKEIMGGSHITSVGEASANTVAIDTGLTTITSAVVNVLDAGNNNVTSDADVTFTNGILTVADGSTYNTVAGQIINWIVYGVA